VREQDDRSRSKVPILGDVPLLGIPFRGERKSDQQNEVIVLVTPYVMETPKDFVNDALRRKEHMKTQGMWSRGWSNSKLADPVMVKPTESVLEPEPEVVEPPARIIRPRGQSRGLMRSPRRKVEPVSIEPIAAAEVAEPEQTVEDTRDENWDPLDDLDPELRKYIKKQDRRWGRKIRRADRRILEEYGIE
jgi:hypothetical protein